MQTIKTIIPDGWEIDKDKSTFEEIVLREIEKKMLFSVEEIPNRKWYINSRGQIEKAEIYGKDANNLSTKERAEAFLALMQLVELRDAWNDGWVADWNNKKGGKFCIYILKNEAIKGILFNTNVILSFKTKKLRDKFFETFKELIETAKELL